MSAEIAKIHTIEWTPQLLYDEPLYIAMNANWNGLLGTDNKFLTDTLRQIIERKGMSSDPTRANTMVQRVRLRARNIRARKQKKNYDINDPTLLMVASTISARHSIFPKNSSRSTACMRSFPICIEYRKWSSRTRSQKKFR